MEPLSDAVCQPAKWLKSSWAKFGEFPSVLKNPFAPCSAPEHDVFVAFRPRFRALLYLRPGRQLLFQHAEAFYDVGLIMVGDGVLKVPVPRFDLRLSQIYYGPFSAVKQPFPAQPFSACRRDTR